MSGFFVAAKAAPITSAAFAGVPFALVGFVAITEGLPHLVGDEALGEDRRLSVCCGHGGSAAAVHEEFCRSYLRRVRLCASIR
jgi:hypothetical protein